MNISFDIVESHRENIFTIVRKINSRIIWYMFGGRNIVPNKHIYKAYNDMFDESDFSNLIFGKGSVRPITKHEHMTRLFDGNVFKFYCMLNEDDQKHFLTYMKLNPCQGLHLTMLFLNYVSLQSKHHISNRSIFCYYYIGSDFKKNMISDFLNDALVSAIH
jgi:hypothetical protein